MTRCLPVALGALLVAGCGIYGDPSHAHLEITNNCGADVSVMVVENRDPREPVSGFTEPVQQVAPGEVLRAGSGSDRTGYFGVAVLQPDGASTLIRIPFDESDDPVEFSLDGENCPISRQ